MPSLVEFGPVVLEKKSKIGKVYRRTDRQTDGRTDRRRTKGDQKSSLELSGKFLIEVLLINSIFTGKNFYSLESVCIVLVMHTTQQCHTISLYQVIASSV